MKLSGLKGIILATLMIMSQFWVRTRYTISPYRGQRSLSNSKIGESSLITLSNLAMIRELDKNRNRVADYVERIIQKKKNNMRELRLIVFPRTNFREKILSIISRDPWTRLIKKFKIIDAILISTRIMHARKLICKLDGMFRWIEGDSQARINSFYLSSTSSLTRIYNLWMSNYCGSEDITVAIIDSGIDTSHPDLKGKVVYYRDLTGESSEPIDLIGHGTMVASIIAGEGVGIKNGVLRLTHYGRAGTEGDIALAFYVEERKQVNITIWWDSTQPNRLYVDLYIEQNNTKRRLINATKSEISIHIELPRGHYRLILSCLSGVIDYLVRAEYNVRDKNIETIRGVAPKVKLAIWKIYRGLKPITNASLVIMALEEIIRLYKTLNITVVNLSLSFQQRIISVDEAVNKLAMHGVIVVTPAGNSFIDMYRQGVYEDQIKSPGTAYFAITVAAINEFYGIALYSSRGGEYTSGSLKYVKPDIAMFGGGMIYGSWVIGADSDYGDFSFEDSVREDYYVAWGTSFSTAYVSGIIALLSSLLMEKNKWSWDINQLLSIKSIIMACTFETTHIGKHEEVFMEAHDKIREPPEFSEGLKDYDEGYGVPYLGACFDALFMEKLNDTLIIEDELSMDKPVIALRIYSTDMLKVAVAANSTDSFLVCIYQGTEFDGSPKVYWSASTNTSKTFLGPGEFVLVAKLTKNVSISIGITIDILARRRVLIIGLCGIAIVVLLIVIYLIYRVAQIVYRFLQKFVRKRKE